MREAPALVLIKKLQEAGCLIRAYDPAAMDEARRVSVIPFIMPRIMYDALLDADAMLMVTEWKEFRLRLGSDPENDEASGYF